MDYGYFTSALIASGVITWSGYQPMIDFGANSRAYGQMTGIGANGTDLFFSANHANYANSSNQDVFAWVLDTTTGNIRSVDGTVTVAAANLPLTLAQLNTTAFRIVNESGSGGDGLFGGSQLSALDSNGYPHLIYGESAVFNTPPIAVKHVRWNGTSWTAPVQITTANGVYFGAALASKDGTGGMRLYVTNPNATYGYNRGGDMASYDFTDAGGWTSSATTIQTASSMYALSNPIAVQNPHPNCRVTFSEIAPGLGAVSPSAYGGNLRTYAYGDGGFITAPYAEDPDATTYLNRLTNAPSQAHRLRVSAMIKELKTAGVWASLDALYLTLNQDTDAAQKNLKGAVYDSVITGTVAFTAFGGVQGDGSTGYIDSKFTPSTASTPNFSANSAEVSIFSLSGAGNAQADFGTAATSGNDFSGFIRIPASGDVARIKANAAGGTNGTQAVATAAGLWSFARSSSSACRVQHNGADFGSYSQTEAGLPTSSITLMRDNTGYSTRPSAAWAIGSYMGLLGNAQLGVALNRYMHDANASLAANTLDNFLRYSNTFTGAGWGIGSAVTLTAGHSSQTVNGATFSATRMQAASGATSTTGALSQTGYDNNTAGANTHELSIYAVSNTGSPQGIAFNPSGGVVNRTVGTTPTRLSGYDGAATTSPLFSIFPQADPVTGAAAFTDIDIWCAQLEPGGTASPYKDNV